MSDLEPFAEKLLTPGTAICSDNYRVGYRLSTTQAILAHVDIPAQTLERAVLDDLLIVPRITLDGMVTADVSIQNDLTSNAHMHVVPTPIDQLVIRGTASDILRVEEAQASELHELLALLERSVSAVRTALAKLAGTN
ncbi:hypothetical protein H8A97_24705 [Bradyrhizobium sp. Arg62]|uniref:hypothetical protein n=1 Tax=Bradyrhizobium brasilense TaxID=1419277 RepID=UPI001E382357|nr:hypothetical protein [Bradyrhizobium brasilense]MCC8948222.1 hypothetical protein [Bradyrhizobium brasilense]